MGQDNNKYTCFNTKEDTVTANFEKNKKMSQIAIIPIEIAMCLSNQ